MPIKSAVHFCVCDSRHPFSSFLGFDSVAAEAVAVAVAAFESAAAAAFLGVLVAVADAAVQNYGQKLVSAGTVGSPFFTSSLCDIFFLRPFFLEKTGFISFIITEMPTNCKQLVQICCRSSAFPEKSFLHKFPFLGYAINSILNRKELFHLE